MMWYHYLAAGGLGLIVGASELISRYRDAPRDALFGAASFFYILVNVLAATLALYLISVFDWRFGLDGNMSDEALKLIQMAVAGFGAMALFRSSLFQVRVGDSDIGIGPSSILQTILGAADRAVDRSRARPRAVVVAEIMKGVSFEKAAVPLPTYCFALMQNLPPEDQQATAKEIATLVGSNMTEQVKVQILGLTLMNLVGEHVLRAAVDSLKAEISA